MLQYKCGDTVVYGVHGVCSIVSLEERTVDRKKVTYYILEPNDQPGTRFFVPVHNEAAVAKMKRIITKQELDDILRSDTYAQSWIEDEGQRKQYYRELIVSGDRSALVRMVRCLYIHKRKQQESGKKFHLSDENFLKDAQKLLDSEFAHILDIPREKVKDYVLSIIEE